MGMESNWYQQTVFLDLAYWDKKAKMSCNLGGLWEEAVWSAKKILP
jgi:hypothetical protein